MEYLQARLDSFTPSKSKRTKASSSKQASKSSKWPHPPTWKATPNSLAEAGFYYAPGPDEPDNVICFMCKKSLHGWEPEDDPFEIHYEKCSDKCAWAVVRCQIPQADGSYDFSDSTRHPTSKAMEKARLDTFAPGQWPHDSVKGHGANSKALAKAGFVCNATRPGDDTAICMYCNLSLGGWDEEDDPYEEHLKRDKKLKTGCAFLKAYAANSLSKSTSKRPPSKSISRPPSRSASQTQKNGDDDAFEDDSEDELAVAPSSGTRAPSGRASKSRSSRASSAPTKTPASRRSTRGTTTGGKTPGSKNAVSSEVEETDVGSESETGRRVSKSKRKAGGRSKARVSAIAEEDGEDDALRVAAPNEDVEMQEQEGEEVPVKEEKRKRGRPPKSAAASKPAAKTKAKKGVEPDVREDVVETDVEPAPSPPPKKTHTRTRSKANLESESEAPAPSKTKSAHTRTKSGPKAKVKQEDEEGPLPASPPAPKRKGKQKASAIEDDEDQDAPPPPKAKGKGPAVPRSKVKPDPEAPDYVADIPSESHPVRERAESGRSTISRPPKSPTRRTPSLSDDAGYATAEPHAEADRMDVDHEEPPAHAPPQNNPRKPLVNGAKAPLQRTVSRTSPRVGDAEAPKRASPVLNGAARGSSAPSSQASSSRPPAKLPSQKSVSKDSLKVIEIDSDGEEAASQEQPTRMPKAPERVAVVNGSKKPGSKSSGKKLQVEVVVPPTQGKLRQHEPEDVHMQEASPTSPVPHEVARSPSPRAVARVEPPGTPVSAVHRSAQVSPARPVEDVHSQADVDVRMADSEPAAAASVSPRTYHPVLAQVPIEKLSNLTEEEAEMTLEEYIRRETELQYVQFKADAERRIEEFKRKAAEARKLIETS